MKYSYPFIHLGEYILKKPFYTDRDALDRNIEKCGQTIKTFQNAIEKEQETIFELKGYIKELDAWERWKAESGVQEDASKVEFIVE